MTVCIAAICNVQGRSMIVGASDRMLSAPDLKYEPPQKKVYQFNSWSVALIAGDPYAQIAICNRTYAFLVTRPPKTVEDVAKAYAEKFSDYRREVAESRFLKPVGLDANSLLDRQGDFPRDFVNGLMFDLQNHRLEVETIIAGIDASGPHLFVITDPGVVECHDLFSFAAIGTGKHHADSQFMMARYTRYEDWRKAMLLTYIAKRRAEVSPTVGAATDLFVINNFQQHGQAIFSDLPMPIQDEFEQIYRRLEDDTAWITQQAFFAAGAFLDDVVRQAQQPQMEMQEPPHQPPPKPPLPESADSIPPPPPEEAPKVPTKTLSEKRKRSARTKRKRKSGQPDGASKEGDTAE